MFSQTKNNFCYFLLLTQNYFEMHIKQDIDYKMVGFQLLHKNQCLNIDDLL